MSDWPQLDELKQLLDVDGDQWDGEETSGGDTSRLTSILAAAIAKVKRDVGDWDEMADEPDVALQRAAMRMAVLMAERSEARTSPGALDLDPVYLANLAGHRRRFAVA